MRSRLPVVLGLFITVAIAVIAMEAGQAVFVQTRDAELRAAPGFLSPIVERLDFGAELAYAAERSGWYQVTSVETEVSGWVPRASVQENRRTELQLSGQSGTRTLTSREIALAGRGFSENLERELAADGKADFAPVDELEAAAVDAEAILAFIRDGSLRQDILREAE